MGLRTPGSPQGASPALMKPREDEKMAADFRDYLNKNLQKGLGSSCVSCRLPREPPDESIHNAVLQTNVQQEGHLRCQRERP